MKKVLIFGMILLLVSSLVACGDKGNSFGDIYDLERVDLVSMIVKQAPDLGDEFDVVHEISSEVKEAFGYILTLSEDEETQLTEADINRVEDLQYMVILTLHDGELALEFGNGYMTVTDGSETKMHFLTIEDLYKLEGYLDRIIKE